MTRTSPLLCMLALASACRAPSAEAPSAAEAEGLATLHAIPRTLAQEGPLGWLRHFDDGPDFRMASDGELKFASHAEARAAMEAFGPTIASMELVWSDPRVEELAPGLAGFETGFDELLVSTSGEETRFDGYVTGLLRKSGPVWRIVTLHWSLKVP